LNLLAMYVIAMPLHLDISTYNIMAPLISPIKFLVSSGAGPLLYMGVILFTITFIMGIHALQSSWTKKVYSSAFQKIWAMLRIWWIVPYLIAHGICGILLMHSYLGIFDLKYSSYKYSGVTCSANDMEFCVDEGHLFLLFSAMVVGIFYFVNFRIRDRYLVEFPTIQVSIWNKIRFTLPQYLKEACFETMLNLPTIYVLYYIFGSYFRVRLVEVTGLLESKAPLNSLANIIDFQLLFFCYIGSCFITLCFKVCWDVLQMCLTSRLDFPVDVDAPIPGKLLLVDALGTEGYLKYLAYHDFKCLTEEESYRFSLLFKLSHPGGNPINWIGILAQALKMIQSSKDAMANFVVEENKLMGIHAPANPVLVPKEKNMKTLYSAPVPIVIEKKTEENPILRQRSILYSMRSLSNPPRNKEREALQNLLDAPKSKKRIAFGLSSIAQMIRDSPLSKYIREANRERRISVIFNNSRLIMWAVESLVNITMASLRHDVDGVIQKDLSHILYICIDYYEVMLEFRELEGRAPPANETCYRSDSIAVQEELHNCLKFAVSQLGYTLRNCFDLLCVNPKYTDLLNQMVSDGVLPSWIEQIPT